MYHQPLEEAPVLKFFAWPPTATTAFGRTERPEMLKRRGLSGLGTFRRCGGNITEAGRTALARWGPRSLSWIYPLYCELERYRERQGRRGDRLQIYPGFGSPIVSRGTSFADRGAGGGTSLGKEDGCAGICYDSQLARRCQDGAAAEFGGTRALPQARPSRSRGCDRDVYPAKKKIGGYDNLGRRMTGRATREGAKGPQRTFRQYFAPAAGLPLGDGWR